MRTPSDRDESICAMFDSFCVTVIRNYSRNLKRAAENRKKYDATGDEAVEYLIELLTHEDVYEAEQLVFYADGYPFISRTKPPVFIPTLRFPMTAISFSGSRNKGGHKNGIHND